MNQRNGVQATYEALKAQIKNSGKNIDSDSLISDIKMPPILTEIIF